MSSLKAVLLAALAAIAPIHPVLITVGVLIFADLATGIWAAHKRGEQVLNSAGWSRTVTKMAVYSTAIICGFLTEHYLIADLVPIAKIAAGAIGIVEIKSIFENLDSINGGSVFKSLIERLSSANNAEKK